MSDKCIMRASESPSARYYAGVVANHWQADPAQLAALVHFDRLTQVYTSHGKARFWQRIWSQKMPVSRGLYLWGRVGRGKTFLMDLFYENVPLAAKRRVHFHRFMQNVHGELSRLAGRSDPLLTVAERIAQSTKLLCLDEFFVSDIGDAMILARLLDGLFAHGVVLVTTSNTPPHLLYKEGLQRTQFLPAIALIQQHCDVVELISTQDYRLRALRQAPLYYTPLGSTAEQALANCFEHLAPGVTHHEPSITIHDRSIAVQREADGVIWFTFAALCEGPRAIADYIELARIYHTIVISNVPQLTTQTEDPARRFVELVDEFYDRNVKLVLSVAVPIIDIYQGERLSAEFARTISRLIEMQSEDYLAREHQP